MSKYVSGWVLAEILVKIYKNTYEYFKTQDKIDITLKFSPDQTENLLEFGIKHLLSNKVQMFIGAATGKIKHTNTSNQVTVTIENSTSKSSLFLHLANNNTTGGKLSTKKQTIKFKLNINEKFFKPENLRQLLDNIYDSIK